MQLDVILDTHGRHKGGMKGSVKNQNDTTGMQRWGRKDQERAGHVFHSDTFLYCCLIR